jgi:hypothetical protein
MNVGGTAYLAVGSGGVTAGTGVQPVLNNLYALGTSGLQWSNVYSVLGTFTGSVSMTGGANFGSVAASSNVDLTKHIALYGSTYGFNVIGGTLNLLANSSSAPAASFSVSSGVAGLTVNPGGNSNNANVAVDGGAALFRSLLLRTTPSLGATGLTRWAIRADNSGESGSNAGSNFIIQNYDDTGAAIAGTPITITRSSGAVVFGTQVSLTGVTNVNAANGLAIGLAGPTIRSGAGAATGTQPSGSIWISTNGSAGARIYVSQGGGTWVPIASV